MIKSTLQVIQRTRPHRNYISPINYEIDQKLKELDFKGDINKKLIDDLCNMMSFEYYDEDIEKCFTNPETWEGRPKDIEYNKNVQEFLRNIKFNSYPGTPLERAIIIAAQLAAMDKQQGGGKGKGKGDSKSKGEGEGEGEEEETIGLFEPGPNRSDPKDVAEQMSLIMEKLKITSDFEKEALELNTVNTLHQVVKLSQKANYLMTKISLKLKHFGKIQVARKRTHITDNHSRKKRYMKLTDVNKILKVNKIKYLDPAFEYKLATNQLLYKEGFKTEEEKQLLMMLIDDSGSMNTPLKVAWRNAVLLNRCEAVANGDAELIVYRFERGLYGRTHLKTKEEAMSFYRTMLKHSPHGGTTDIEGCLKKCITEIESMHGFNPDIMIVLDGQDHFDDMDNKGVKVHAVIIGTQHASLEKFCKKTGGMFLYEDERQERQ